MGAGTGTDAGAAAVVDIDADEGGELVGGGAEVFGLGVITPMPGLMRSGQSRIFHGLPLRTRNTVVVV